MDDKNRHVLPVDPPITKRSLSCLDFHIILDNTRLLHDIVVDGYVQFHPSHDKIVATHRREQERLFWQTLHNELETSSNPKKRALLVENYGIKADWCFPRFLRVVREILVTLIRPSDHGIVEEGLNVDEIIEEYYKGDLDVAKIAEWLSDLLKTHCAPCRDETVDQMVGLLKQRLVLN